MEKNSKNLFNAGPWIWGDQDLQTFGVGKKELQPDLAAEKGWGEAYRGGLGGGSWGHRGGGALGGGRGRGFLGMGRGGMVGEADVGMQKVAEIYGRDRWSRRSDNP